MIVSYMPVENCPKCGQMLDYFKTFSTHGKKCRSCKWKEEIDDFTGKEYKPLPDGVYTITVNGCSS